MEFITRAQWGARPPSGAGNALGDPQGVTVHYEGPKMASRAHSECPALVRSIQLFHQNTRGWSDIAYNLMVCEHGAVFEGRGAHRGNAANGTTESNLSRFSACALIGEGNVPTDALKAGLCDAIVYLRNEGKAGPIVDCHSDHFQTACPGDLLRAWVRAGTPRPVGVVTRVKQTVSRTVRRVARPAPRFPYVLHAGSKNRYVKQVQARLNAAMNPSPHLTVDGDYGPATERAVTGWQRQHKSLGVDGVVGPETWKSIFA